MVLGHLGLHIGPLATSCEPVSRRAWVRKITEAPPEIRHADLGEHATMHAARALCHARPVHAGMGHTRPAGSRRYALEKPPPVPGGGEQVVHWQSNSALSQPPPVG
jgi:hypothetical protein